jgi:isoleucyl-tRNA synthetase
MEKSDIAKREEAVLAFWNEQKIFEQSLAKPAPKGDFVFYDGPPFASGTPHFGHLLQSFIKDAVPRFRTMQGYHVARRWGWDCHGLPIENIIEAELGIKEKRDIEKIGIDVFNEAARVAVTRYADVWKQVVPRIGRFVDMEHDYRTMDATYTESVWWAFKKLHGKGLIYEGFKAMHLCPRCGTTLANFEVAQGYKDIDDIAVTVKLPLVDEPNTSLLIWTTTPWTLPGNTAAAVNAEAVYVKVKVGAEFFVVSKNFSIDGEIISEFLGKELVGKKYLPPFDYFANELHKHKTHAWKVYAAPYVTTDDGTGIVHLAPAYGEEDLKLAQQEKIPLIHHVTEEGKFIHTVADFAGMPVKPKGRHMETDAKIVENLQSRGLLFAQEKINHSYPHCWRCDTPLLNWAATSWFVNVQKIKNKLRAENAKVSWVPEHVGTGRFQNGLASAPDWAISRSRFWGAPLPVWRHSKTKELKFIGSVAELLTLTRRSGNTYFVMRHGESLHNVQHLLDPNGDPNNHLTHKGRQEVARTALDLKRTQIDMIITSPFLRTRETAEIVQQELGLPDSAVMSDERLHEFNETTVAEVRTRVGEFLFEVERRYSKKNILIITHGNPLWVIQKVAARSSDNAFTTDEMFATAEVRELSFTPYPHNADYELDLHRPYIDQIALGNSLDGEWKRVPDVFDCWFESGAMPFASNHYPFENKKLFNPERAFGLLPKGYPANFIAESIDQTRGWFYSLIVLGIALFGRSPYKAVITNGLVLAADGRKMSKKLKNYPDPLELVDAFGADALRYYLLSSPLIRGEDLNFSARGVEEVAKKLIMRLANIISFYGLYADGTARSAESTHALDRWILSRLNELIRDTTAGFEKYELDAATRPLASFIDDLSTWYLRRSRDRFKTDGTEKAEALATLRFVLFTLSHTMTPMMPFFAEDIFRTVREEHDAESVNLEAWPSAGTIDEMLLADMQLVRAVSSTALQIREKAAMKIRQPLAQLKAKKLPADAGLRALIADEVNVKEVVEDSEMEGEVWLDTELTPALKEEGIVRDLVRAIQDWRKQEKMQITDRPAHVLKVSTEEEMRVAEKFKAEIAAQTGLAKLEVELVEHA